MRINKATKSKKIRVSVALNTGLNDEYEGCLAKIGAKKGPHAATLIEAFVSAQRRAS